MKVEIQFGCDTPFGLATVRLDSADEEQLTEKQVWSEVGRVSWERHKVDVMDVVDFKVYAHDGAHLHFKNGELVPSNWDWLPENERRK